MRKRLLQVVALTALIVLLAEGPHLVWMLRARRTLAIAIVDKTVPFRNYREHAFVPWLLRSAKVSNPGGRFLDETHDYVGYDPVRRRGQDVEAAHVASADVLFIADTYGVYVGDYEEPGDIAALERSPKIYGGMTRDEADVVEAFAARGGLVIAEFNTFASPTNDAARRKLEATFGARWTKWVGRYWPDMQDPNEVPRWVGRVYQRVYGRPLEVRGAAFVFVREDQDIFVLEAGRHLDPEVVTLHRTAEGADLEGLPRESAYRYWLDVVECTAGDVLYEHVLHLTPDGAALVAAHGVPARFPALVRRHGRPTFYFAGDFVDSGVERGDPERAALLWWRRVMSALNAAPEERFLWGWYAPVLDRLIEPRVR
jgi:hypothetical protein